MARATISDAKSILPSGSQLTDFQIQAAIDAATCIVDQAAASCASHLTDSCLLQVEIYLSAHFGAATEIALSLKSETDPCGGAASYGFQMGEGVKGSPFGQLANTLSGGCLAEFDKSPIDMISIGCA